MDITKVSDLQLAKLLAEQEHLKNVYVKNVESIHVELNLRLERDKKNEEAKKEKSEEEKG